MIVAVVTDFLIKSSGDKETFAPVATSAFGVISTIAGAYFGIKVGADSTKALADGIASGKIGSTGESDSGNGAPAIQTGGATPNPPAPITPAPDA